MAASALFPRYTTAQNVNGIATDPSATAPKFLHSALPDFGTTAPSAGEIQARGFIKSGPDGHFHFAEGTRARFWGINVSSTRLNIPNDQIEAVVGNFARAGLNMVRLEAIDNRNCLLGGVSATDSQHFDPAYLDRLDYWMDCLRRHGIYYYLDLLDFRTFKAGDNVLNAEQMARGARPYALYDRYLIQLQKDYANQLLRHRNRYSGLMPLEDPALALVEICNEHGFFLYPEKLEALLEPYRTDLLTRWSKWLKAKYGSREQLVARWGAINGINVLRDDEDPDKLSVSLPVLTGTYTPLPPNAADILHAPTRVRDGVQFLAEVQRAYFKEMYAYLRAIGLRCPITAVVSNSLIPDISTVAQECDFTAENWYGEGQNADSRTPGLVYYSNRNSLRDDSAGGFAPFTSALRWQNKPVVIREWATSWPNRARAASVPEALAYASLQDFDAVLLFGYQTNRAPNGAEANALNDFAVQVDPTIWGLYALAGQAFLRQTIAPATHVITYAYTPESLVVWPNNAADLYRAAWSVRVNNEISNSRRPDAITPTNGDRDLNTLRFLLNTLGKRGVPVSATNVSNHIWKSDTEEIVRYSNEGRLEIHTPTLVVISGEFAPNHLYSVGRLRFTTQTPFGTLFALALDGQPLEKSEHLVVKMVSRAVNTGETLEKSPPGFQFPYVLKAAGKGPVITDGRPASKPTRLWFVLPATAATIVKASTPGTPTSKPASAPPLRATEDLVRVGLVNGTWELELREGAATFLCDTPGINVVALGQSFTTGTPGTTGTIGTTGATDTTGAVNKIDTNKIDTNKIGTMGSNRTELTGLPPLPLPPVRTQLALNTALANHTSNHNSLPSRSGGTQRTGNKIEKRREEKTEKKKAQKKTEKKKTEKKKTEKKERTKHLTGRGKIRAKVRSKARSKVVLPKRHVRLHKTDS